MKEWKVDNQIKTLAIIMRPGPRPSIREIAAELGVTVNAVCGFLERLKRKGLVTWEPGKSRTLVARCRFIRESELSC